MYLTQSHGPPQFQFDVHLFFSLFSIVLFLYPPCIFPFVSHILTCVSVLQPFWLMDTLIHTDCINATWILHSIGQALLFCEQVSCVLENFPESLVWRLTIQMWDIAESCKCVCWLYPTLSVILYCEVSVSVSKPWSKYLCITLAIMHYIIGHLMCHYTIDL